MITVSLNKRDFEYDVHSLVKAFYPKEDVLVRTQPEGFEDAENVLLKLAIKYEDEKIGAVLSDEADQELLSETVEIEYEKDRRETKSALKRLLYRMLEKHTGISLPWGDLTGIRPTKIPMELLEKGWGNAQIAEHLREQYFVSAPKTALAIMIANKEKYLLDQMDYRNGYSLYVGIPFCPSICLYCSFSSSAISAWKNKVEDYLAALFKEIEATAKIMGEKELQTVYIGGGTPTTLEADQMDRLLAKIEEQFDLSHVREFTVEAGRPDSITEAKLAVIRKHGIDRISINPQTMNQKTLDIIGRKHTVEQIEETYDLARSMGFDNINMDLIIGLPGEGMEEVAHTMGELERLGPDSVTVHSLALKRATRLNLFKDDYQDISFRNSSEIMDLTMRSCEGRGLSPYYMYRQKNMAGNFENVGYSVPGKECLYNILIMEEVQSILALGAGASTKLVWNDGRIERIENVKDIKNYIERIDEMIERKQAILSMDL